MTLGGGPSYKADDHAVRALGASVQIWTFQLLADIVFSGPETVIVEQVFEPQVDFFLDGYFEVCVQASGQATQAVKVAFVVDVGPARRQVGALGNSAVNRPSSTSNTVISQQIFVATSGSIGIAVIGIVQPAPGPGTCTINADSDPAFNSVTVVAKYFRDPLVAPL